jgi:3-dehydroquinate dehydratase-2
MKRILILNGPNLNLLGTRQPEIYGHATLSDVADMCARVAQDLGVAVEFAQSNSEGALIDILHQARGTIDGVVFNAGAYTHTSVALRDAITASDLPVIELHISNVHARETFRHYSMIAPVCLGVICGLGVAGYPLALRAMCDHVSALR